MSLVLILTCECNPGKTYASRSTYQAHARSIRHGKWEAEQRSRDVYVMLHEKEQVIRQLEHRIVELEQKVVDLCKPRRKVSQNLKKQVAWDQDWKCFTCGEKLPPCYEIDHVRALWRGGSNERDNLCALCRNCDGAKTMMEAGSDTHT